MSLAIDIDKVHEVLLDDGWHDVYWNDGVSTLYFDAYEYLWHTSHDRAQVFQDAKLTTLGFGFQAEGIGWIYGPISSIKAVRTGT
jgi:hypothetical protein